MTLKIYTDGGARGNPGPAAAGIIIRDPQGHSILEAGYFLGKATNNVAEYTALVMALQAAVKFGADQVSLFADSELMVKQLTGEYKVKDAKMQELFKQAQRLLIKFTSWKIQHIRRAENKQADILVNKALDAGKDIVEVQLGDAQPQNRPQQADETLAAASSVAAAPRPADPAQPSASQPAALPPVLVKVVRGPRAGGCNAAPAEGQEFAFGETAPARMCVYALKAAFDTVLAMRYAAAENDTLSPVRVRCMRRGCGAEFEIRLSETGSQPPFGQDKLF